MQHLAKNLSQKVIRHPVGVYTAFGVYLSWRFAKWLGREIGSIATLLVNIRVWVVAAIAAVAVTLGLLHLAVVHGPNVTALAVAAYSEGKGESPLGRKAIVASVFERVTRSDFPTTPADVIYQVRSNGKGCQYDGPCDRVPDNLNSPLGRKIFLEILIHYVEWEFGMFQSPVPGCHSYATMKGFENASAYFSQFPEQRTVGNHVFFCGDAVTMSDSPQAVKTSPRPKRRPTDVATTAAINAAVAQAWHD